MPRARPPGGAGPGDADTVVEPHARGFVVIAVPRSPAAPHAVLVHQSLRYPKRNGATTRYLSEPEVAAAYRERLAGARHQSTRLGEVEREALERLDPAGLAWVVVTLAPELPGDLFITNEVHRAFQAHITGQPATITSADLRFRRVSVGPGRLLADGTMDNSPLAKYVSLDLHTDGAGAYGVCVVDLLQQRRQMNGQQGEPELRMIHDEALVIAVLSGLLHLACHARERAAAGGAALVRAQIYPLSAQRPAELGRINRHGLADELGTRVLSAWPRVAEAAAPLDDLAQPGPSLIQAGAVLVSQIGHAFGIAELGQLSRDGQIRRHHWAHTPITAWAEQHGIGITEDTVTMSW